MNSDIRVRSRFGLSFSIVAGIAILSLILSLFVSLVVPFTASAAPVNLFANGFESPAGFSPWTSVNNDWSIISDNHSGSKSAEVKDANGDELRKNISTSGYGSITLSYWYKIPGGLSSNDHLKVQWSTDGVNWTTIRDYANSSTVANWVKATHNLPAGANNNGNFRFRFYGYDLGNNDKFRLDDVSLDASVLDTTAPVITVTPATQTIEATGPSGASATFGATANEPLSGSISCTPASGSTFALGATTVTCSATDIAGNTGSGSATVTVVDTTGPEITLNGSATINLSVGDSFTDEGATAEDLVDGDVPVVVDGDTVNTNVPGTYVIYYNASDEEGNDADEVSRTVTVSDVSAPEVTITPASQTVEATGPSGATANYTVSAVDDVDGDISGSATCGPIASGATFPLGVTTITCTATDSADLTGSGAGTVTVVDTTAPVITLTGSPTVTLTVGGLYTEEGATASDILDGSISVTVGGNVVDVNTVGTYVVTYNVTDAAGNNAVEVTRTVQVTAVVCGENQHLVENSCVDNTPVVPECNDNQHLVENICVDNAPEAPAPTGNGGGSGGGGGGGVVGNGPFSLGFVTQNNGGSVLGASTDAPSCGVHISSYLRKGGKNNVEQVKKLQTFLNTHEAAGLEVNGTFDQATFDAVKAFQTKYADEILKPWFAKGLSKDMNASGYVYKTTIRMINKISCASLNIPQPQLP